ncbi:hypothetical protein [Microcystis aeruginosa]|uniref:hypothetical protein n=1 Tax=Microcystis aeruginosa TaxID=1126 RepID=UPI00129417AA|nr:hypothetical protein [Microcystis aeruginosa]
MNYEVGKWGSGGISTKTLKPYLLPIADRLIPTSNLNAWAAYSIAPACFNKETIA